MEDEIILALTLAEHLHDLGGDVLGPYTNLSEAGNAVRTDGFDVAVLDINLNGDMVYPLADELLARGVPFLFLSGYGRSNLDARFRDAVLVQKPYDPNMLAERIVALLACRG